MGACFHLAVPVCKLHEEDVSTIMKRMISLMLCAVMLLGVLSACTTLEKGDKGMVINVYIATELFDFDPARHFNDDAMVKIYDLIYEGLTDLDENGKWKKALMKEYEIIGNAEDGYSMLITLNNTRWSDGRTVQAADFVYAWKRILSVDYHSEAATLLYDVKNAYEVKQGDVSIDDVGIAAVDTYVIQVDFVSEINVDNFFQKLASPALVPLREDIVDRDTYWATQTATIATNGPFAIKEINKGGVLRLERSVQYYLNPEAENQALDTYVIPYKMLNDYSVTDVIAEFEAGKLFYVAEIPLASRAEYKKEAKVTDLLATHTYCFNTNNELFKDARVRRALSMALDRNEIVNIVTFAKPATGLIPEKVFNTTAKTSFRKEGENLIASTADVAGAKALLQQAGVTSGSFSIAIRQNEVDRAVADYVKGVWESLGFKVTVEEIKPKKLIDYDRAYADTFAVKYETGNFDVIAIDAQMLSTDPFTALAPFAAAFSGNGVDMNSANYDLYPHVTGYNSEAYNSLIASAYAEKDASARAAILHEAEKLLMEDMPIAPLFFMQDAYLIHDDLSGYKSSYFGSRDFKGMKLKNYMDYLPKETAAPQE